MTDKYGNDQIEVGFSHTIEGVGFHLRHPETGEGYEVIRVDPEFAREIAMNFTLESWEVEKLRKEEKSSGG